MICQAWFGAYGYVTYLPRRAGVQIIRSSDLSAKVTQSTIKRPPDAAMLEMQANLRQREAALLCVSGAKTMRFA